MAIDWSTRVNTRSRKSRSSVTWAESSATSQMRLIEATVSTGYLPLAVSADNITASVPSSTALATSDTSARVGTGLEIIDSIIRSEEHTSELQSHSDLVCRLLLETKKNNGREHNSTV